MPFKMLVAYETVVELLSFNERRIRSYLKPNYADISHFPDINRERAI